MIDKIDITNVLFLDIETVSGYASYDELTDEFKKLWKLKTKSILRKYDEPITDEEAAEAFEEKAGIFAEFGKIVCISVGFVVRDATTQKLSVRLKSYADHDEKKLLEEFSGVLNKHFNDPKHQRGGKHYLCGHNLNEFDTPYMCRRMLIHQMELPKILDIAGKKPWELQSQLDTLVMWKFGDYKNYTALKLLCACFGIPSPKDDIDGSEVGRVYWKEDDLERIAVYCEKDVLAVVQLLLKYKRQPLLEDDQIHFVGR
ncbi:MAG: ribonuclease H-like domain-containing protein [Saprospiraceae bacterium]